LIVEHRKMRVLNIAGASLNQTPLDWKGNLENIREAIKMAKSQKVDILCLPELCITAYGCEDLFLSQWLPLKALDQLAQIVSETQGICVAIGLPVPYKGKLYNCACLISDGQLLGFTAKQFLANDGVHYEPRWFTPWVPEKVVSIDFNGQKYPFGDVTYQVKGINIAFEICEDAWHSTERPGIRHCKKLDKLDLLLNPSASHFAFDKTFLREKEVVLSGSERFNCTYVYVNLLGNEAGRMIYDGDIMIAQNGKMLNKNHRLSFANVNLISTSVNFNEPAKSHPVRYFDITKKEEEFAAASALGIFDYMRKSRSKGFVLSLSGGADSSSIAILVAEMVRRGVDELGTDLFLKKLNLSHLSNELKQLSTKEINKRIVREIFFCAYQGTVNSSQDTLDSAQNLAESIGAEFHYWLIDEEVKSYSEKVEKAIGRKLTWEKDDLAMQNIQARSRSPIIWMFANIRNSLLLTTSNRSEGDVGYATMDGDTSGSLAPIAAVDKYFILHWLRWAEKKLGYDGLAAVNQLQPSAELRPLERTQTDEKDLMPYKVIVEIEKLAIRDRLVPVEVYKKLVEVNLEPADLLKEHIIKFYRMWSRNQWKRERIAPAFHLDDFNVDPRTWCRFPILSAGFEEELEVLNQLAIGSKQ